jgi:hypothetical protein
MRLSAEQILSEDEIRAKISSAEKLNIIWCASIVPSKMPNLFFDSLRLLKNKNLVSVKVIGGVGRIDKGKIRRLEFRRIHGKNSAESGGKLLAERKSSRDDFVHGMQLHGNF